jgi:4-hydroxybenzoate polyprenyltransferase
VGRPADVLRLVRAPLAPTAACDAVACALLARGPGLAVDGGPAAAAVGPLLLLAATSVLVYAAGMAGNDLADLSRDRTIAPDRPLPSGRLSPRFAGALVVSCAAGALLLGGGPAGHVVPVAAALLFALLYDVLHARFPLASAPLMGLVRFSNAATGVWPLVLAQAASPIALLGPGVLGLYSAAVTVWSTAEGRPAVPRPRALLTKGLLLVAVSGAGLLAAAAAEGWTLPVLLGPPAMGLAILFGRVPRKASVKTQVLEMLLALYYVDAVLASGGFRGTDWVAALATIGAAQALVVASVLAIRALRPR